MLDAAARGPHLRRARRSPRVGFFTDTSLCIGCKACEVACKEWNHVPDDDQGFTGDSYDNTRRARRRHAGATSRSSSSAGRSAPTARRRSLVQTAAPSSSPSDAGLETYQEGDGLRWLMASDVCKHCTDAACLDVCPTGALFRTEFGTVVVQEDVCNGCGYCVPACPFGVLDRREERRPGLEVHALLRPPARTTWSRPARKACPTNSIQFGELDDLRERAERAARRRCTTAGQDEARLYGADRDDGVGGFGAFFLLLDEPEVYGLPPDPVATTRDLGVGWAAAGAAAVALGAGVAAAVLGGAAMSGEGATRPAGGAALLLRAAGAQAAGLDAGDPVRTSSPAASPAPRPGSRCVAELRAATTAGAPRVADARSPAVGGQPGAADLRPRAAGALPQHAAGVQGDLADERRLVDRWPASGAADGGRGRRRADRPAARAPARGRAAPSAAVLGPAARDLHRARCWPNTAVPVWHEARRELPFVFAAGAATSAGAAAVARHAARGTPRPARRLARRRRGRRARGRARLMERRLGDARRAVPRGRRRAATRARAQALTAAGAAVARRPRRARRRAAASRAARCCSRGALCERCSRLPAPASSRPPTRTRRSGRSARDRRRRAARSQSQKMMCRTAEDRVDAVLRERSSASESPPPAGSPR